MMNEYIDKYELISTIKRIYCDDCRNYDGVRCRACETNDVLCIIEDSPSAEVEPIVHCEDCKWKSYLLYDADSPEMCRCSGMYVLGDNSFCSYGERETNV